MPPSPSTPIRRWLPLVLSLLLIALAASRILRLNALNMNGDEVWTVWQTLGTLQQTVEWVSYDASPLYFILVHVWGQLTGIHPVTIRLLSVFTGMISAALVYSIASALFRRTLEWSVGLLAMLAFSSLGYLAYLDTMLRPYVFGLMAWLVAFRLTIPYCQQPSLRNAVFLSLALAVTFYVHVTALFGMIALGLFGLIVYRRFRPWVLPTVLTGALCLPEAISKLGTIGVKADFATRVGSLPPPPTAIANLFIDFGGDQAAVIGVLFLIAGALLLDQIRVRKLGRPLAAIALWLAMPFGLVWFTQRFDAFNPRHLAWIMAGIALWIGGGLALLPSAARRAVMLILVACAFAYMPLTERYEVFPRPPLVQLLPIMREEFRSGDVLLLDLNCQGCMGIGAEEWAYYNRTFFDGQLQFIQPQNNLGTDLSAIRRIWHISTPRRESPDLLSALDRSHALSQTFGEATLTFRLYEAPPDAIGIAFENGMRLQGVEISSNNRLSLMWRRGEPIRVRLWWSVTQPIPLDYSTAILVTTLGSGMELARRDEPPQLVNGPKETSQWQSGRVYLDERTLTLNSIPDSNTMRVSLGVYQWWDGKRIAAPGQNQDLLFPLGIIHTEMR